VNGAALDVRDFEVGPVIGNVDGGLLLAFLREDLDALIKSLVVGHVVGGFFAVEVDGGGAGSLGFGGHLEFFVGGLLELCAQQAGGCEEHEQENGTQEKKFRMKFSFWETGPV